MIKCSIIGANGFIGKHLDYYLSQMGAEIHCYDIQDNTNQRYHKVDITNPLSVQEISLDVDYVIMLAGLNGTHVGFDQYSQFIDVNEKGLLNLLDAVKKSSYRPRIIFPSSRLVYKGKEEALKEDDEKDARTIYAINKLACEGMLKAYANSFDVPYTIFRICVPFGNMLAKDYSYGTIGFFIRQAKTNRKITLYGDGHFKRTFSSMKDICEQIVYASLKEESTNQTYNIGGCTCSLKEAAEVVASHFNAKVEFIPFPERDLRIESGSTYFDASKIESLLGERKYEDIHSLF